MNQYTDEQIKNTLNIIESTIKNCEKIQPKFKEGTPQLSLSRNRIKALNVSKDLITQQEHNYTEEELKGMQRVNLEMATVFFDFCKENGLTAYFCG